LVVAASVRRVGCFVVHDHPGARTDFVLGVKGICMDGPRGLPNLDVACHDLGLYYALGGATLALILLWPAMWRRPGLATGVALVFSGLLHLAVQSVAFTGPSVRAVWCQVVVLLLGVFVCTVVGIRGARSRGSG